MAEKYLEIHRMRPFQSCKLSPRPIDIFVSEVSPALFALSSQLSDIEAKFRDAISYFNKVSEAYKVDLEKYASVMNLGGLMKSVSQAFETLLTNVQIAEESDTEALRSVACDDINRYLLQNLTDKLRNGLDPKKSQLKTAVQIILGKLKIEPIYFCGVGQSTYEYLHAIYTRVILAEIKAYAIQVFYVYLLYKYEGNLVDCLFTEDKSDARVKTLQDNLKEHLTAYTSIFTDAMQQVSRDHHACDTGRLDRDETFIELTGAVQTIVQFLEIPDEIQIVYDYEAHDNLCEYFDPESSSYACVQGDLPWCLTDRRKPCFGDVFTCNAIRGVFVCLTEDDSRRYQWVISHMTHRNTTGLSCAGREIEITDHVCLCLCYDYGVDSVSTHLFNLQPVESDTASNKIVTGVKFMVKNNVMQFQIQQGTLGPHWNVSDVNWKEVKDISEEIRFARLGTKLRGEFPNVAEYRDFLIIDARIGTEINLNRLTVPHGYVLTGVQFVAQKPYSTTPKRVHIALIANKFDYETGQLYEKKETVVNYTRHTDELIYNTQNVNNYDTPLTKVSKSNQFVTIKPSDWRSADSGQTTLPYCDAIPVQTKPASPIGGMELFYKTTISGQFAGMLSLALISLDYEDYMND